MRVVRAFGPGDLRVVESIRPVPEAGEVLVAVRASGICGSDKWYWRSAGFSEKIAGHEVAGEIVGMGNGVKHLGPGDRVAVNNVVGCGVCPACRKGAFVLCPRRPGRDVDNGFSEFVVVPERNCLKLRPELGFDAGCLVFDAWGTPYAALRRAGLRSVADVCVSGCGPIGLALVALAKREGHFVIALDPVGSRLDAAVGLGADFAMVPDSEVPGNIRHLTSGLGVECFFDCSGRGESIETGFRSLRHEGTLVSVGEGAELRFRPSDLLIRNRLSWLGSWYSTMRQGAEVQRLMANGEIDPFAVVSHRIAFEEVPSMFGRFVNADDGIRKIVILNYAR